MLPADTTIQPVTGRDAAAAVFDGWEETMLWSCIQGVMGRLFAPAGRTDCCMALLGDFCFLAGEPDEALARFCPEDRRGSFVLLTPQNEAWAALLERCWGQKARRTERYAFYKGDGSEFDRAALAAAAAALPEGFVLRRMDEALYRACLAQAWSRDLVALYGSWERYQALGLGVAAVQDGVLAAGASAYSRYRTGIEIEIDTRADLRRRGLARACGAQLILDCLDRGLYPSWDAQNQGSAALARQLGYRYRHAYPVYEVSGWGE